MEKLKTIFNFYKNTLVENKTWVLVAVGVFLLAVVAGVVTFRYNTSLADILLNQLRKIVGDSEPENFSLVVRIFTQNLQVSLIALYGGVIFGVVPFVLSAFNGFIIGYIVTYLLSLLERGGGQKVLIIAALLLPHGVFELPAILFSAALGMRLGLGWVLQPSGGTQKQEFVHVLKTSLKYLPLLVLALFFAALIEVYITPALGYLAIGK